MSEHPEAPKRGVAYPVTLGDSLRSSSAAAGAAGTSGKGGRGGKGGGGGGGGGGGDSYVALKYDWKVGGIDPNKAGKLKRERDSNKVSVQFQSLVEGERAIRYQVRYPTRTTTTDVCRHGDCHLRIECRCRTF